MFAPLFFIGAENKGKLGDVEKNGKQKEKTRRIINKKQKERSKQMGFREALKIMSEMVWSALKGIVLLIREIRRERKDKDKQR